MANNTTDDANTGSKQEPTSKQQAASLRLMIYSFQVSPIRGNIKQFALQLPFSVLVDNLIAVLWSIYNKESKIICGINQIEWALEFLKCLKIDYKYPENIGKIVKLLEKIMIELYSKINVIQYKKKMEEDSSVEIEVKETDPKKDEAEDEEVSFNEQEIVQKLEDITLLTDKKTGEPRCLKELNALGKRKPKHDPSKNDNKPPQTTVIVGALKKIVKKSNDADTISEVEDLIKEILQNTPAAGGTKSQTKQSAV